MSGTNAIPFIKMQGLGNDFVVIDRRDREIVLETHGLAAIADRRLGIGCDQVLVIDPPANGAAAADMLIYNPDGSEAEACGNGTRCVARLLMDETGSDSLTIRTIAGDLACARSGPAVAVDMGLVRTGWEDIPLSGAADTLRLPIEQGPLRDPVGVNIGNPHLVFFVEDADAVDLPAHGPTLEHHPMLPDRANIEVVTVLSPSHLRMRVWERSAGITQACGSGACASAVAANRRGLAEKSVTVSLDGGDLGIEWLENGHILMSGPTAISFTGSITLPTG